MMFSKFSNYYKQFGPAGILLAIRTRLARRPFPVKVRPRRLGCEIELRLKTTDVPTLWKIFHDREYDFSLQNDPEFIIDAGANIGLATLFFLKKYPRARIVALEPEGENFAILERNVAGFPNVTAIRGALWNEVTMINVVDPGLGPWAFQVVGEELHTGAKLIDRVPAYSVESLMKDFGAEQLDLLKIDIEGAERKVFEYSSNWIPKTQAIMAELHEHLVPGVNQTFERATQPFGSRKNQGETVFCRRE